MKNPQAIQNINNLLDWGAIFASIGTVIAWFNGIAPALISFLTIILLCYRILVRREELKEKRK